MKRQRYVLAVLIVLSLIGGVAPASAQIEVFFNRPVDTTLAMEGNAAVGDVDFSRIVEAELATARHSIDMTMYNLSVDRVVDALVAARDRGVRVRVIAHVANITDGSDFARLDSLGIPLFHNPEVPEGERQPLMHDKFFVIDAGEGVLPDADPRVITGSWNATFYQTYTDANNLLVIEDSAVAHAYLMEFEEMWGGSGDQPDSVLARFGAAKSDNTPHHFVLSDGTRIEVHFSPSDSTSSQIDRVLETADHEIYAALFSFTYNDLGSRIRSEVEGDQVDARILIDNVDDWGSEFEYVGEFAEAYDWMGEGQLHHKYALVDALDTVGTVGPAVITGSHNWSMGAETINDENTLVIYSTRVANLYLQEFAARYREAGGLRPFRPTNSVQQVRLPESLRLW